MKKQTFLLLISALGLGVVIDVAALAAAPLATSLLPSWRWLSAFTTHTVMAGLALIMMSFFSKGSFRDYGLNRGQFVFKPTLLLWVLPTGILSVMAFFASPDGSELKGPFEYTALETIVFIWIYASMCEELFTRGLLQGYLEPLRKYGFRFLKRWYLSVPVLFSGIFFGLMHVVAIKVMGPPVLVFTTILGLIAGYYREKTGSIWPAILIHALFNVGAKGPTWLLTILLR